MPDIKMSFSVFLLSLFLATFITSCAQEKEQKTSRTKIEITDMTGSKIVLNEAPKRAVFLVGESWAYALKIKDKVVAFSDLAKRNPVILKIDPEVSKVPSIGDMGKVNEEAVMNLNPDVIIVWDQPPGYRETAKRLEKTNIPVVRIGYIKRYPDDICTQAKLLGKLFEAETRADQICSYLIEIWSDVISKRPKNDIRVLYSFTSPTYIACNMPDQAYVTFINSAGGKVLSPDCRGTWVRVSKEWILEVNPEVWIISYFAPYSEKDIFNDTVFKELDAVKNGRVYKESYRPMQFFEPYFILTLSEYWEWINGQKLIDENHFISRIYTQ